MSHIITSRLNKINAETHAESVYCPHKQCHCDATSHGSQQLMMPGVQIISPQVKHGHTHYTLCIVYSRCHVITRYNNAMHVMTLVKLAGHLTLGLNNLIVQYACCIKEVKG